MKMTRQLDSREIKERIRVFAEDNEIDSLVARELGSYVYALYKPDSDLPFYIGEGEGTRVLDHFYEAIRLVRNSKKLSVIGDLFAGGNSPDIRIIRRGIESKEIALSIEASLIDVFKPEGNAVLGNKAKALGIIDLKNLISEYSANPLEEREICDRLMFIKVDRYWEWYDLSRNFDPERLYDITRRFWKINRKRAQGRLVCSVVGGIIREVYEPEEWHPAGDLTQVDPERLPNDPKRRLQFTLRSQFTGSPTVNPQYRKYVNRDVKALFKKGAQSPVTYWPRS